jgi:hypothetical protein
MNRNVNVNTQSSGTTLPLCSSVIPVKEPETISADDLHVSSCGHSSLMGALDDIVLSINALDIESIASETT